MYLLAVTISATVLLVTEDSIAGDMPWPRADDDPFAEHSEWIFNACLNFSHGDDWHAYALGYKRLAELGVAHIAQSGAEQDYLVFPVVFCYRQFIELELKKIIIEARLLTDAPGSGVAGHDLLKLWTIAEPLLAKVNPGERPLLRVVRGYLEQFERVDPRSDAFRYPMSRSGDPSLPNVTHINLRQVYEAMQRLGAFLDATVMQLEVERDLKQEVEAEYGPDERG